MELASLLQSAILGKSPKERQLAEESLKQAETTEFIPYLAALTKTLDDEAQPTEVRMLACIALKNVLSSNDSVEYERKTQKWIELDPMAKDQIKTVALKALISQDSRVGKSAAQLVSAIAAIDLHRGEWMPLIDILIQNTADQQPENIKVASLKAIGYTCEMIKEEYIGQMAQYTNGFLVSILQGIKSEQSTDIVREAALEALVNSLGFVKASFEKKDERDYIMTAVCSSTQIENEAVQMVAYAALNRIMALYYEYMNDYMEVALFPLTASAINSNNESIVMLALEFWSTVCEAEMLNDDGTTQRVQNYHFAEKSIPVMIPRVLEKMINDDEYAADDEWNTAMSAASTLELFARACGDAVAQPTIDFVGANLGSTEWNKREAAVMAFGSILDGPNPEALGMLMQQAMQPILALIHDPSIAVKDTVSWCIGRICDLLSFAINLEIHLQPLMAALLIGFKDHPKVSTNCCWAFMNLIEQVQIDSTGETSAPFSPYYQVLFQTFMEITNKPTNEASSRTSAYEALSTLIVFSSEDAQNLVIGSAQEIISRIEATIPIQQQLSQDLDRVSADDRNNLEELQSSLLGVLANIIRRTESLIKDGADQIMDLCLRLMQSRLPNSLIDDDVLVVMGALATAIGQPFAKYLSVLMPFLIDDALKKTRISVAHTAVGLISDCCLAVGKEIEPYAGAIMQTFVEIFQQQGIYENLKSALLSCIGDIASCLGAGFQNYLPITMNVLSEASMIRAEHNSTAEYVNYAYSLHEAVLDAYVGIVASCVDAPQLLSPYIASIFGFLAYIQGDSYMMSNTSVLNSVVGLLGDISAMYPNGEISQNYTENWVRDVIETAAQSGNPKLQTTAEWAHSQLKLQLSLVR